MRAWLVSVGLTATVLVLATAPASAASLTTPHTIAAVQSAQTAPAGQPSSPPEALPSSRPEAQPSSPPEAQPSSTPGAQQSPAAAAQEPTGPGKEVNVDINVNPTGSAGYWYRSPLWIGIAALAVIVLLLIVVLASRGSGSMTTILRE